MEITHPAKKEKSGLTTKVSQASNLLEMPTPRYVLPRLKSRFAAPPGATAEQAVCYADTQSLS
jgi:hypothetical protein